MSKKNETNVQVIENATRADVRPGDHITWEQTEVRYGATRFTRREGIAHHRSSPVGDWVTDENGWLTDGEGMGITITIRRPVQDLPMEDGTQIIPAHGAIEAVWDGVTYTTRHATYDATEDAWVGVWRGENDHSTYEMYSSYINPDTWKTKESAQ